MDGAGSTPEGIIPVIILVHKIQIAILHEAAIRQLGHFLCLSW